MTYIQVHVAVERAPLVFQNLRLVFIDCCLSINIILSYQASQALHLKITGFQQIIQINITG